MNTVNHESISFWNYIINIFLKVILGKWGPMRPKLGASYYCKIPQSQSHLLTVMDISC